jgi:trehalose 6-phosphate phosphatase
MQFLCADWSNIRKKLRQASHIILISDYDGTLTPIVERPEFAILSDRARTALKILVLKQDFKIVIISGRSLSDLKNRIGVQGIIYAGNHGLEIEGPGISFVSRIARESQPFLSMISNVLNQALRPISGASVENKGLTISVHYRQVKPRHVNDVKDIVEKIVGPAEASGNVRITAGKKIYEIRPPVDWNKGKAIEFIIKHFGIGCPISALVPIFIGDDLTDEDGFKVVETYGNGISILVGEPYKNSSAHYYLRTPEEAILLLEYFVTTTRDVCHTTDTNKCEQGI